jgi:UDP-MurNAc hydroxylase
MRATSIGHAGILIDTVDGSIVCDPWFLPAFFDSWCVFPRNDQLGDDLMRRIEHADYLYITHLHGDHLDEPWLRQHISRDIKVLLPGYPTRELERTLAGFGFTNFVRTDDGKEVALGPNLRIAIHVETSITDGPGGDSAMVVSDGTARLVNQNDCRTNDLTALRAHGPVDLHWLQYSGAIWYPMVYDVPAEEMRALVAAKVDSQFARAMRYVETIDAAAVVPSAGPPAFLDPELFGFNVITGDESSIFPDQRSFLSRLDAAGHQGILAIPGTEIEIHHGEPPLVRHPIADGDVAAIFDDKETYLRRYQADWLPYIQRNKDAWAAPTVDLLATLQAWWEPILRMAPTLCAAVGGAVVLHGTSSNPEEQLSVVIDFPTAQVREFAGEEHSFWFRIDRRLIETVVAQRAVDWSNALFLSCRFQAWRAGPFNEYVYNFFKSLSVERMRLTEAEALRKLDPDRGGLADLELEIGDYVVQRTCPHRGADLAVFGEADGCTLTCTLHGWKFDLDTGRCLTADDRTLRVRRRS